ncbi:GntP family permease [Aneurinibacillus sp. Ricciae_BoGa-3]|uniref:GntP family permease n=1 Tax=Aneurinibacillus sp. Ricciae_BoGa-3 TaxID=3022697 RepID=UPI00234177D1|nr:SLC13 family permease [Aneurinibacillus sp. Ricciae_BoGa-3]WCK54087.1 GntP family permease [Aneurinibacillus sp. Ricciae_BoGa-3]
MSLVFLIIGLGLLIFMTMKGINIIVSAIVATSFIALTSAENLAKALTETYMKGFSGYFASWFILFLLGAIFGKVMEDTGAADSIATWIMKVLGPKGAVMATVLACAVMTYGGVSLFVVGFSVYPLALSLFRGANLPRRFIPAALVFGSISFTMTMPGSPEIQNLIPTKFFHTTPWAGSWIGILMALCIFVTGSIYLTRTVNKAVARGEKFEESLSEIEAAQREIAAASGTVSVKNLPNPLLATIPLIGVIVILAVLSQHIDASSAAVYSLGSGIFLAWILMFNHVKKFWKSLADGSQEAIVATCNTCAVVGFGSVAATTNGFHQVVQAVTHIPGPPLLGLGVAVTLICGLTGSASGGLGIALPILSPIYMAMGIDPGAMHRISALASGGLDALPHNGYIVTTIRAICGDTHKRAYGPVFVVSVVITTIAMFIAILLFSFFS